MPEASEPLATTVTRGTLASAEELAAYLLRGGIDTVAAGASGDVDDVLTAYREAGTPAVVCLTGPDALYADWGADLVPALREAGARRVVVAGKEKSVDAPVDDAAAMGVDALAFLRRTREELAS